VVFSPRRLQWGKLASVPWFLYFSFPPESRPMALLFLLSYDLFSVVGRVFFGRRFSYNAVSRWGLSYAVPLSFAKTTRLGAPAALKRMAAFYRETFPFFPVASFPPPNDGVDLFCVNFSRTVLSGTLRVIKGHPRGRCTCQPHSSSPPSAPGSPSVLSVHRLFLGRVFFPSS